MAKTIAQLTPTERLQFDPTRNLGQSLAPQRWESAWSRLPELKKLLQAEFGATRVVVLGSVATKETFTHWSDIDLAVWGVLPERFYAAVAAVNDQSPDIKVDLVDAERCRSLVLRQVIEEEGVEF